MTIRIACIISAAVTTLVLSASPAASQGRPPQQVVLSEAVIKSMAAGKPKSKTPLGARVGVVRKSGAVTVKPGQAAPTSVREISPTAKKK